MELYLEQLEQGSQPDRDRFLAQFPDIADQLAKHLDGLEFVHRAAPGLGAIDGPDPAERLPPRTTLGDFKLIRPIGCGGMGIVYEAEQLSLGRVVAVKLLRFAGMLDNHQLKRFQNEARAAASLEHPNIVPIYFVGKERGVHFFAMKLIDGLSLAAVIQSLKAERHVGTRGANNDDQPAVADTSIPLSTRRSNEQAFYHNVADSMRQAALALQHAHEQGVVHRDIKPGNLLIDSAGKLWVTDFGLAHVDHHESITAHGDVLGTVAYMSPEQLTGAQLADVRSDVYSLGATLYELLTLQTPFGGNTKTTSGGGVERRELRSPRRICADIPVDLETIVLKALSYEPADRYRSALLLAEDLERFSTGRPIHARRLSAVDKALRWARRHHKFMAASCAVAITMSAILSASIVSVWDARGRAESALQKSQQYAEHVEDLLYLADVQQAYQAWDGQRVDQVNKILERQRPTAEKRDRRGFEWFLLDDLARQPAPRVVGTHSGSANEVAVFPDGQRIASVGADGKLCVWHIETGELIKTIEVGPKPLHAVAIAPDGSTVATGGFGKVECWNVETGNRELELADFETYVYAIAFSPNGKRIVAGCRSYRVRLYDRSGQLLRDFEDDSEHKTLEFTPDGKRLLMPCQVKQANGRGEGFIRVWKADMSDFEHDLFIPERGPARSKYTFATSSPDGTFYALSEHSRYNPHTRLIDANTYAELLRLPPHLGARVNATAISPNENILAAGFADGTVAYWQLDRNEAGEFISPQRTNSVPAHRGRVVSVKFAGASRLVTCGADGLVKVWDLRVGDNPRLVGPRVAGLAISPDGQTLVLAKGEGGLELRDAMGGPLTQLDQQNPLLTRAMAFSRDGQFLATCNDEAGQDDVLHLRDGRTGDTIRQIQLGSKVESVSFSPIGNELAATTHKQGQVYVLDLERKVEVQAIPLGEDGTYICLYSPNGRLLCAGEPRGIRVYDSASAELLNNVEAPSQTFCLAFDGEATVLASGHEDGSIRLWDWPSGERRAVLVGHEQAVVGLDISHDGRLAVSSSKDGTIRLWSIEFQREHGVVHRTTPISWGGWDVAFSPDGHRLFAAFGRRPGLMVFHVDHQSLP